MAYTTTNKGHNVTVIPTFREKSYPGERITQEQWDEIFGVNNEPKPSKCRVFHHNNDKIEEKLYYTLGVKETWKNGVLIKRETI